MLETLGFPESEPSKFPLLSSSSHPTELISCRCYCCWCLAPSVHILLFMESPSYAEGAVFFSHLCLGGEVLDNLKNAFFFSVANLPPWFSKNL